MRKKRIMIIGAANSGKTTLANLINDIESPIKINQDVIYGERTIDIPSSYLENPSMYKNIITLSQDARIILILIDSKKRDFIYPHGFAYLFNCEVVGVITKCDEEIESEKKLIDQIRYIGMEKYFYISKYKKESIENFKEYLFQKNIE